MPCACRALVAELPRLSAAALLLVFLAGAPAGCDTSRRAEPASREQPSRLAPAERGALRARRDIADGRLRVYRYGNPVGLDNPRADPESGLPVRTLLDCCVSDEGRAETEAYNRTMRAEAGLRAGRAPGGPAR